MRKFWVSWYASGTSFELHSPWWISGYQLNADGTDTPTICAAVQADDAEMAKRIIYRAHNIPPKDFALRFVEERPDTWTPYSDRFPKADWMIWP